MSITSKIQTIIWYLRRPKLYRQFIRLAYSKLAPDRFEKTEEQSVKWCASQSLDTFDFLKKLSDVDYKPVDKLFEKEFSEAHKMAQSLPVKMGGGGAASLLYYLSEFIQAERIIETGVAHGWSSLVLLLSFTDRDQGLLVSTDMPYAKMGNEDFVGCVVPERLKNKWQLIRKPDITGLPEAFNLLPEIDLCHYDSDKTYAGRMWAYPKLWERLRPGGVFISDDIGDNMAFADFCSQINVRPNIIKFKNQYVGVILK